MNDINRYEKQGHNSSVPEDPLQNNFRSLIAGAFTDASLILEVITVTLSHRIISQSLLAYLSHSL